MQKRGRPTKKVKNLRRFTKQWEEFTGDPQALTRFDDKDADYIREALHWDTSPNEFSSLADALQGETE
jgi:hypothetical protein